MPGGKSCSSNSGRAGAAQRRRDRNAPACGRSLQGAGTPDRGDQSRLPVGGGPEAGIGDVEHPSLPAGLQCPLADTDQRPGDKDYAKAYGVTEVPANVLIDREGTVVQIDLVSKNLESMIARAVGR